MPSGERLPFYPGGYFFKHIVRQVYFPQKLTHRFYGIFLKLPRRLLSLFSFSVMCSISFVFINTGPMLAQAYLRNSVPRILRPRLAPGLPPSRLPTCLPSVPAVAEATFFTLRSMAFCCARLPSAQPFLRRPHPSGAAFPFAPVFFQGLLPGMLQPLRCRNSKTEPRSEGVLYFRYRLEPFTAPDLSSSDSIPIWLSGGRMNTCCAISARPFRPACRRWPSPVPSVESSSSVLKSGFSWKDSAAAFRALRSAGYRHAGRALFYCRAERQCRRATG